jgi:radical SAM protein with 4Fe4S-binding SPASM domain
MSQIEANAVERSTIGTSIPKWIFFQLLESCNLRCKMCYEWGENGPYNEKPILKQLDINVIKKTIIECSSAKPFYELYGGEPLLYPQIDEVMETITHYGSKMHMPTNGTLLEKHAEMLVEAKPDRIWVSLDGPEEINDLQRGKGVFKKVKKGIEKLFELRESKGNTYPRIGISMVVTPLNYRYIEQFFFQSIDVTKLDCISMELQAYITDDDHRRYVEVLKNDFGIEGAPMAKGFIRDPKEFAEIDFHELARQLQVVQDYCSAHQIYCNMYPKSINVEDLRKYFSADWFSMSNVKKRCVFPWVSTEINARGDVTSCHAYYDLTLGNVYEQSLLEIWNGDRYADYRNHLKKQLFPICQGCCLFYNEKPFN